MDLSVAGSRGTLKGSMQHVLGRAGHWSWALACLSSGGEASCPGLAVGRRGWRVGSYLLTKPHTAVVSSFPSTLLFPVLFCRLVHSGSGRRSPCLGSELTFATRTGSRQGIEMHVFRVETHRDLSSWTRVLVQGCHAAAELIKEVVLGTAHTAESGHGSEPWLSHLAGRQAAYLQPGPGVGSFLGLSPCLEVSELVLSHTGPSWRA